MIYYIYFCINETFRIQGTGIEKEVSPSSITPYKNRILIKMVSRRKEDQNRDEWNEKLVLSEQGSDLIKCLQISNLGTIRTI